MRTAPEKTNAMCVGKVAFDLISLRRALHRAQKTSYDASGSKTGPRIITVVLSQHNMKGRFRLRNGLDGARSRKWKTRTVRKTLGLSHVGVV